MTTDSRSTSLPPWLPWGLAGLALLLLLGRLGALSLRQWDEARLAVSALEMVKSGHWLVPTYEFRPDLWNTKPPLLIWCQAGLIGLMGASEWAVRLPSALASLGTLVLLYRFASRFLALPWAGFITGLILLSSQGFSGEHVGRTGDYDAVLVCFQTIFALALFRFLETGRRREWLWVGLGLALALLTKSVAALLALPGVVVYCFWQRGLGQIVRAPGFWLAALGSMLAAGAWYWSREQMAPGYWQAVWDNELGGRFASSLEAHNHAWYFYWQQMARAKFLPWLWFLPLTVPFALRHPNHRARLAARFSLCWAVGLLVVISTARTKLHWYAAPAYPWLALLLALGLPGLRAWLLARWPMPGAVRGLTAAGVVLLSVPYIANALHEQRRITTDAVPDSRFGYPLRYLAVTAAPSDTLILIVPPGYNAALRFYELAYPAPVRHVAPPDVPTLRPGARVLACDDSTARAVRTRFPRAAVRGLAVPPLPSCSLFTLPATPD